MEGWLYAVSNMGVPQEEVDRRFILNAQIFSPKTDPDTVLALARSEGIDYLICDRAYTQAGDTGAQFERLECVFDTPEVRIYCVPGEP